MTSWWFASGDDVTNVTDAQKFAVVLEGLGSIVCPCYVLGKGNFLKRTGFETKRISEISMIYIFKHLGLKCQLLFVGVFLFPYGKKRYSCYFSWG